MSGVPSRRLNALVEFSDLSDDEMPWIAVLPRTRVPSSLCCKMQTVCVVSSYSLAL